MPVKKFKSFQEATEDLWCLHPDQAYYNRVRRFYEFAAHFVKLNHPRGIFKFKSFEEAEAQKQKVSEGTPQTEEHKRR
jgi:hypothetical protein